MYHVFLNFINGQKDNSGIQNISRIHIVLYINYSHFNDFQKVYQKKSTTIIFAFPSLTTRCQLNSGAGISSKHPEMTWPFKNTCRKMPSARSFIRRFPQSIKFKYSSIFIKNY